MTCVGSTVIAGVASTSLVGVLVGWLEGSSGWPQWDPSVSTDTTLLIDALRNPLHALLALRCLLCQVGIDYKC